MQNICHMLSSPFIIKCIFYDYERYFNLQYNINMQKLTAPNYFDYFNDANFLKFASSKSNNNNY